MEIASLDACDGASLAARWRRLTGRPPGPGLRGELLRWAISVRLQEQAAGGFSPALQRRLALLARAHAREIRDAAAGGDVAIGKGGRGSNGKVGDGRGDASGPLRAPRRIKPGSRLIREWRGVTHEVVVVPEGYLWNGTTHASLSAIALAITGTSWNGWRFFGVERAGAKIERKTEWSRQAEPRTQRSRSTDLDSGRRHQADPMPPIPAGGPDAPSPAAENPHGAR